MARAYAGLNSPIVLFKLDGGSAALYLDFVFHSSSDAILAASTLVCAPFGYQPVMDLRYVLRGSIDFSLCPWLKPVMNLRSASRSSIDFSLFRFRRLTQHESRTAQGTGAQTKVYATSEGTT
jgi:hypothetical protein